MEFLIGASIGVGVALVAAWTGLDRDRAFYPVVLVVSSSYYDLFAVISGSWPALGLGTLGLALFFTVAVIGYRTNLWLVAAGLIAHGAFDLGHHQLITDAGVAGWWPMFCMAFDVAAAGCLAVRLLPTGPHVRAALRAAAACEKAGERSAAFRHLERAHVLGQSYTIDHVRVHAHMLGWSLRARDASEALAQLLRIVGAATLTMFGWVPLGNTGGSNIGPFRAAPIPPDLAALISAPPRASFRRRLAVVLRAGSR